MMINSLVDLSVSSLVIDSSIDSFVDDLSIDSLVDDSSTDSFVDSFVDSLVDHSVVDIMIDSLLLIQDSAICRSKDRSTETLNRIRREEIFESSTHRELSQFEHVKMS